MGTGQEPNKSKTEPTGAAEPAGEQTLLEALEQAATAVGVTVRYDKLATGDIKSTSGLCKIRGVDTIIIDRRLGPKERVAALARELSRFNFDDVFLPPAARELVEPAGNGVGKPGFPPSRE
jgi:hypothetical protein